MIGQGCPPDCGGCSCHLSPPCWHCTEHGCELCGEFDCACVEMPVEPVPPLKPSSKPFNAMRIATAMMAASMGFGAGMGFPSMSFSSGRSGPKSKAKERNRERNAKAQKAAKRRRR